MAALRLQAAVHLAVDMQRLFGEPGSPWFVPWFAPVLPQVAAPARHRPERTHDALMTLYREGFSQQLAMATTVQILEAGTERRPARLAPPDDRPAEERSGRVRQPSPTRQR